MDLDTVDDIIGGRVLLVPRAGRLVALLGEPLMMATAGTALAVLWSVRPQRPATAASRSEVPCTGSAVHVPEAPVMVGGGGRS